MVEPLIWKICEKSSQIESFPQGSGVKIHKKYMKPTILGDALQNLWNHLGVKKIEPSVKRSGKKGKSSSFICTTSRPWSWPNWNKISTNLSIKNWMGPYQRTPEQVAIELLDTQVFPGSVQWVLLEISWNLDFPEINGFPLLLATFLGWGRVRSL